MSATVSALLLVATATTATSSVSDGRPLARAVTATSTQASTEEPSPLHFSGYVQVDFQKLDRSSDQLDDGSGLPLNEDAFLIRRARLRCDGSWEHLGFHAETQFSTVSGPRLGMRHVEGFARWPEQEAPLLRIGAGLIPVPFGFETYEQSNVHRVFSERSLFSTAFVPGQYDLGARLSGSWAWLDWVLAVQNGEPIGEESFPGLDPNAGKDVAGRVGLRSEPFDDVRLNGGLFGLVGRGFHPGTQPTKDRLVWRDFNEDGIVQQSELVPIQGAAGSISESFDRFGVGADLQIVTTLADVGELGIYGEVALGVNLDRGVAPEDPVSLGRDQRSLGWYLAVTQSLWDVGLVGFRVDQYDPNADSLDLQGGETVLARRPFTTYTGVLGAMMGAGPAAARALLEYAHQENGLGRDDLGLPTRLQNDVLRARLEVSF